MKVGIGYDIHKIDKKRKLFLGGVEIPSNFGLAGHSDADVLIHAIIDALLGAMGKGDIGDMFPNTDKAYEDISSMELLEEVKTLVVNEGYDISNIDCNIILENPKLGDYKIEIKNNLAKVLGIEENKINVKAKTKEGMDCIGKGEAVEVQVVTLINNN